MNEYTAINTKVRAMKKNLITHDESGAETLRSFRSLNELFTFLQNREGYKRALQNVSPDTLSPTEFVERVYQGVTNVFLKLYRFANLNQRKVLELYGMRYEERFIKHVLLGVEKEQRVPIVVHPFTDYLETKRKFNITDLLIQTTVTGVINTFKETDYAPFFDHFHDIFQKNGYDHYIFESQFDQYYQSLVFKKARKVFSKAEFQAFQKVHGNEMAIANITLIYRLKFLYHMDDAYIYDQLFQPNHQLNEDDIATLIRSSDQATFKNNVAIMGYDSILDNQTLSIFDIEKQRELLDGLLLSASRHNQNSMLPVLEYLESKQQEARDLVLTIERISYFETPKRKEPIR